MARKGSNIYKRKDGRYEGRVPIGYKEDGKLKYKSVYDRTLSGVKEKMTQFYTVRQERTVSNLKLTVRDAAEQWLAAAKLRVKPDHAKIKQLYSKQAAIRSTEWTRGIVSKDSTGYDACVSQYRAVCSAGIQRKIYKFHYAQGGEETIGCAECGRAKTAGTISFAQPYQNKLRDSAVSVHRFACGRTMRPDLGRY